MNQELALGTRILSESRGSFCRADVKTPLRNDNRKSLRAEPVLQRQVCDRHCYRLVIPPIDCTDRVGDE